jgi:signal transduction histidine kinase
MFSERRPGYSEEHAPLRDARVKTDEKLAREREDTDEELREKVEKPEAETDETLRRTRREVDRALESAEQDAAREAAAPTDAAEALEQTHATAREALEAERAKAQAAVAQVAEKAQEAVSVERERVEEATAREREERKGAFLEVLAQERRETDEALGLERASSDLLVSNRDEILAMISHDLRNVINAIALKAGILQKSLSGKASADEKRLTESIRKSCKVLSRWAGDLVDISSLNTGALGLEREACAPADIVDEAVEAFRAKAEEKGLELSVDVGDRGLSLRCDRDRVVQVLANLLDNAIKFTPPSGAITVRVERAEGQVRFSVSDTGPGIADADRDKIFDQHWHIGRMKGGGTGLGLYICRRVIQSHGGELWVESEAGQGSTFFFTLSAE